MAAAVMHLQNACLPARICMPCGPQPTGVNNPSVNPIRVVAPILLQCKYLHRVSPMQVTYARVGLVKEDIPGVILLEVFMPALHRVTLLHGETKVLHVTLHGVHQGCALCSEQVQLLALHGGPPCGMPHVHPPLY